MESQSPRNKVGWPSYLSTTVLHVNPTNIYIHVAIPNYNKLGCAGLPDGAPPPWLINMQRYGPPPSYPSLKIPGLNAPIPLNATFGYRPGEWGKPPVDEVCYVKLHFVGSAVVKCFS